MAAIAGCGGDGSTNAPFEHAGTIEASIATNGEFPPDEDPADGLPPEFSNPPADPGVDPSTFETLEVNGETIPLVPVDVAAAWYARREARVADARGLPQYTSAHIYGAVLSTAQEGSTGGGIPDWPTDERIVTYCGCPHHLSSIRAAGLRKAGYADVFAIDEGFVGQPDAWAAKGYPMAGTEFRTDEQSALSEWQVTGAVDARFAGEYVWAAADRQYEAGPIAADGSFALTLRFADVTEATPIEVRTPAATVTRSLGELAAEPLDLRS
jgi:rhodanese-related sulfurtransferase